MSNCCTSVSRCLENLPIIGHAMSAVYACEGKRDKAERAAIKATAGIILAPISFTAEVIDEATCARSEVLKSAPMTGRGDWMRRHRARTLRNICLPGTHQSGAYHVTDRLRHMPASDGWSLCQRLDIAQQLAVGVRFLDLKLMMRHKEIWVFHEQITCVRLREVLETVREFVGRFTSEIVMIHVEAGDSSNFDWSACQLLIQELLKDQLIPEIMRDMVIGDIVDQRKHVIVTGVPQASYNWTQIDCRWSNVSTAAELRSHLDSTLEDLQLSPATSLVWYRAECSPLRAMMTRCGGGLPSCIERWRGGSGSGEKIEFMEQLAATANHEVLAALTGVTKLPFNVLTTDYVHDEVIARIIALNLNAERGFVVSVLDQSSAGDSVDDVFRSPTSTSLPGGMRLINTTFNSSTMNNTSFEFRQTGGPLVHHRESHL